MSEPDRPGPGAIAWHDLTVVDAAGIRDFYRDVAGWQAAPVEMGGYEDFTMLPRLGGDPVAGICHARGPNADLPAQWLLYIIVEDVDAAAARCLELGGELVRPPTATGEARLAVIRDPAGAVCALYQP